MIVANLILTHLYSSAVKILVLKTACHTILNSFIAKVFTLVFAEYSHHRISQYCVLLGISRQAIELFPATTLIHYFIPRSTPGTFPLPPPRRPPLNSTVGPPAPLPLALLARSTVSLW